MNNDGYIDLFLPAYRVATDPNDPNIAPSHGNFFFENRETDPNECAGYIRRLVAPDDPHGLENELRETQPGMPEGAQMCDYDGDGDLDVFVFNWRPNNGSGCVHQNRTASAGTPAAFRFLEPASAGFIALADEGLALADLDMDGDFDLVLLDPFEESFVLAYVNLGDGSFGDEPHVAAGAPNYGLSLADFDLDGDIDLMRAVA